MNQSRVMVINVYLQLTWVASGVGVEHVFGGSAFALSTPDAI